jgi:6-pyruvoyltetrahydropterin/6-carboxytetrahydropterin synthase
LRSRKRQRSQNRSWLRFLKHLIARRHLFSTAHLYSQSKFDAAENARVFGPCFTPHGHGHNYVLEAFVTGPLDSATGLVMNVTDLDIHMKTVCAPFDHHHINFDVPEFKEAIPTTENLAAYLFGKLKTELAAKESHLSLHHIRLFETEDLWSEASEKGTGLFSRVQRTRENNPVPFSVVTVQVEIRAIHHLENASYSEKQNRDVYGICYGVHGHHYKVQVSCKGSISERTGLAIDRDAISEILQNKIVRPFDGVDLNKRFQNTSCEALAKEFFEILQPEIGKDRLVKIGVQETRKNYFEFPATE